MIKCVRCGNGNSDEVVFCQFCGTRLVAEPLPEPLREIAVGPSGAMPGGMGMSGAGSRGGAVAYDRGFRLVVVHRDGSDGMAYSLMGHQIDIGRTDGDLLFDDPHLAPRHARIVVSPNGWVLSPLELRNGVYLRLRAPVDLNDGDHFLIGKQVLRYEICSDAERNIHAAVEHGVALFGTPTRPAWARLRQVTPNGVTRDMHHLSRSEVILGREQGDVVFSEDEFMSRRHAQLALRSGRGRLEDLGSSNGTFVRLRGPQTLTSGDLIRLGDELLRFELG